MNRRDSQVIRLKQLLDQTQPGQSLGAVRLPIGGWLKAVRQALGRSLKSVGAELKTSPQAIHQFEKSESAGAISLRQLEAVAGALGCRVVYSLVPRQGTLADLANSSREQTRRAVRHTMALEDQAVDDPATPR
jgi:predicted DNA-binding mobile mystery protein A